MDGLNLVGFPVDENTDRAENVPSPGSSGISVHFSDSDGQLNSSPTEFRPATPIKPFQPESASKSRRKQSMPIRCSSNQHSPKKEEPIVPEPSQPSQPKKFADIAASPQDSGVEEAPQPEQTQVKKKRRAYRSRKDAEIPPAQSAFRVPPTGGDMAQQWMSLYMQNLTLQQMLQTRGLGAPSGMPFFGMAPMPTFPFFPPNFAAPPPFSMQAEQLIVPRSEESGPKHELIPERSQKTSFDCRICHNNLTSNTYLKKHLAKKHGVFDDTDFTETKTEMTAEPTQKIVLKIKRAKRPVPTSSVEPDSQTGENPEGNATETPVLKELLERQGLSNGGLFRPYFTPEKSLVADSSQSPDGVRSAFLQSPEDENEVLDLTSANMPSSLIDQVQTLPESGSCSGVDLELHCMLCNREYCSKYFLRKHLQKVHGLSSSAYLQQVEKHYPEVYARFAKMPDSFVRGDDEDTGLAEKNVTEPARQNWCIYCRKNLCNKYFFRDHMMKKHRDILDGQILVEKRSERKSAKAVHHCEVCLKNYSSKYFLKVHRRRAHGIFSEPITMTSSYSSSILQPETVLAEIRADMDDQQNANFEDSHKEQQVAAQPTTH